jgi:hypothetical protein
MIQVKPVLAPTTVEKLISTDKTLEPTGLFYRRLIENCYSNKTCMVPFTTGAFCKVSARPQATLGPAE